MPTTLISGRPIDVNDEGFLIAYDQWDEKLGAELARLIGVSACSTNLASAAWWRCTPTAGGWPGRRVRSQSLARVTDVATIEV